MLDTINPDDVFPRRNLPADAEQWGRTIEQRIKDLEAAYQAREQDLAGTNRALASSTAVLSDQISKTVSVVNGGMWDNATDIFFNGTTGPGNVSYTYWRPTPLIVPEGFAMMSVMHVISIAARFPGLYPTLSGAYRFNGSVVSGTSNVQLVNGATVPGPLYGNASPNITTYTVGDSRVFDITARAGQTLEIGATVGFSTSSMPVPDQTIRPEIRTSYLILFSN